MARIAIVVGHARQGTYCEALGEAYKRGAEAAGHEARLFVTSRMQFDPILREGYLRVQTLEPDLAAAHDAILEATHLVLIFPLYLGTLPAIFKGFLERILQPDIMEPAKTGTFVQVLKGKSARIIMTMGMPGIVYRWWFGAHALKMLKRNILAFMGVAPIRSTIYGMIEGVSAAKRQQWLRDVEELGRDAA
jgi:putative NADPH-quinone reductase